MNEIIEIQLNEGNPKNIEFQSDITKDSYNYFMAVDTFLVFKAINNIYLCVFSDIKNSIISYDLIENKTINKIKNAHENNISCLRYYLDKNNKRDLVLSLSYLDSNIKLWNINTLELILNLKNINDEACMYSACFLNYKDENYIISSIDNLKGLSNKYEPIKIFDFNGKKVKVLNFEEIGEQIIYIITYYDKKLSKTYILTGNQRGFLTSSDIDTNKFYHKYEKYNYPNDYINLEQTFYFDLKIIENEKMTKLIGANSYGYILLFDFHKGNFLELFEVCFDGIHGLCLWNFEYLFVACDDSKIRLVEIETRKIVKELDGHKKPIISIKKFKHPLYGECLVSQTIFNDYIKLWTIQE